MDALHTREGGRRQNWSARSRKVSIVWLYIAGFIYQTPIIPWLPANSSGRRLTIGPRRQVIRDNANLVNFAIFSDIHGNLEALEAVLADIALKGSRR